MFKIQQANQQPINWQHTNIHTHKNNMRIGVTPHRTQIRTFPWKSRETKRQRLTLRLSTSAPEMEPVDPTLHGLIVEIGKQASDQTSETATATSNARCYGSWWRRGKQVNLHGGQSGNYTVALSLPNRHTPTQAASTERHKERGKEREKKKKNRNKLPLIIQEPFFARSCLVRTKPPNLTSVRRCIRQQWKIPR